MLTDARRTVPARIVEDIDAPDAGPGSLMLTTRQGSDEVCGYLFACPGCGAQSGMFLRPLDPGVPRWTVTAGDPSRAEGLTLSPSIHHTTSQGGCGWHGWLREGIFVSC